jgi:hypothetical protein
MTTRDVVIIVIVAAAGITYALAQQATTPSQTALVCAYNATPVSVTTGQFVMVQCDAHGYLLTKTSP